jgi:hypothetical protein
MCPFRAADGSGKASISRHKLAMVYSHPVCVILNFLKSIEAMGSVDENAAKSTSRLGFAHADCQANFG